MSSQQRSATPKANAYRSVKSKVKIELERNKPAASASSISPRRTSSADSKWTRGGGLCPVFEEYLWSGLCRRCNYPEAAHKEQQQNDDDGESKRKGDAGNEKRESSVDNLSTKRYDRKACLGASKKKNESNAVNSTKNTTQEIYTLQCQLSDLEHKHRAALDDLKAAQEAVLMEKKRSQQSRTLLQAKDSELEELQKKNAALELQMKKADEPSRGTSAQRDQTANLRGQLQAKVKKIEELKGSIAETEKSTKKRELELKEQVADLQRKLKLLRPSRGSDQMAQKITELETENKQLKQEKVESQQKVDTEHIKWQTEKDEYEKRLSEAQKELQELNRVSHQPENESKKRSPGEENDPQLHLEPLPCPPKRRLRGLDRLQALGYSKQDIEKMRRGKRKEIRDADNCSTERNDGLPRWPSAKSEAQSTNGYLARQRQREVEHNQKVVADQRSTGSC